MGIRAKIILLVMLALMVLCGGYVSLLMHEHRHRHLELIEQVDRYIQASLNHELAQIHQRYHHRLEGFIKTSPDLVERFIQKDRQGLKRLVDGKVAIMQKENPDFFSISFINRDGTVLLRTAMPEMAGDSALDIPFVAKVFSEKIPLYGLTIARWGLAFRLARPVFSNDGFQGIIVFVVRPLSGLKLMKESFGVSCGVLIDRHATQLLNGEGHRVFGDYLLMEQQGQLFDHFVDLPAPEAIGNGREWQEGGERYLFFSPVELTNFAGDVIGYIQPVQYHTPQEQRHNTMLNEAMLSGFGLMVLTSGILYLGIGLLLKRVDELNNELEQRVVARTEELRLTNEQLKYEVEERELVQLELERLSRIDSLTGLANRRYFDELAGMEWRDARREGRPLALLMIDVDYFKTYNDYYGHPAGDDCLQKVAVVLKRQLKRPRDIVARYGGEEFICLLPATDSAQGREIAEDMRRSIAELDILHQGSLCSGRVTVSVGVVSCIPQRGETLEPLVNCADKALYRAKQAGRDRTVIYTEDSGMQ